MCASSASGPQSLSARFITGEYFPKHKSEIPFGEMLESIFFNPSDLNADYPVHGPNVIRFTGALLELDRKADGLFKGAVKQLHGIYASYYPEIMKSLEVNLQVPGELERIKDLLTISALYHDIGKCIRKANHPQIGANIVRNFNAQDQKQLVEMLGYPNDVNGNSKNNRFALLTSVVQHHDKFGVVSTGEGALPIFSDILYFTSDQESIGGVKKNVTSVMIINLADIAAVNTSSNKNKARAIANKVFQGREQGAAYITEDDDLNALCTEMCHPDSCLGLNHDKLRNVLLDWEEVIEAISHEQVNGNRSALKLRLLELERNPARAIQRVRRLLHEACQTGRVRIHDLITQTSVESALVGTLGAHQFQTFCEQFATVAKLDYGLSFFKAIVCAAARKSMGPAITSGRWDLLSPQEEDAVAKMSTEERALIANAVTILFVRVLETLVSRYVGVLEHTSQNPRRFGFQMRNLTEDNRVREAIIKFLCIEEHRDPIALTWMADEVTIWSMD